MALFPGTRLGHYDVTALLGEGGMGQAWQATDTQLNRQVALKILPDAFAADPDRLARFTREAEILASLNHPNIAAIHGIEEAAYTSTEPSGDHALDPLGIGMSNYDVSVDGERFLMVVARRWAGRRRFTRCRAGPKLV